MNFYKRYMGDWSRDTAHLTMLERGAYNDMLDYYYATCKPLPQAKDQLYRIARAMNAGERRAVDSIADQFFPVGQDGLRHNKRADKEIAKHEVQATINRETGKRGGRPKKTESDSESETESVSCLEPNDNPNQIPDTRTTPQSPPEGGMSEQFLAFWRAWPKNERKESKGTCWSLWRKGKFDSLAGEILAHVEACKQSERWRSGFICAPKVYLNNKRWEGAELPQAQGSSW